MGSVSGKRSLASLLSYLQGPDSDDGLKLELIRQLAPAGDNAYPFVVLDDSAPVSRNIEASFVTDSGSLLKKVLLHIQKDQYALTSEPLRPVTNLDIDAAWQKAFKGTRDFPGGLLSSQVDETGRLTPLSPLFYCRERHRYFHPVCPSCGDSLRLCQDDEILKQFGFSPYSTSLKRYLYCEQCASLRVSEFYVYERDHTDPVTIKDRWSLIDQFRLIDETVAPDGKFPCIRCLERATCYGPNQIVRSRIIPFSFYPFYLLISEAPSLNVIDFVNLVSGATTDGVNKSVELCANPGRVHALKEFRESGFQGGFFFGRGDNRFFLEILFIKLSVLSSILQRSREWKDPAQAKLRSDRIWVRIPDKNHLLPSFWNFTLEIIADISPVSSRVLQPTVTADTYIYLGLLWFQILLQNRAISQNDVLNAVTGYLSPQADVGSPFTGRSKTLEALFTPENIFWDTANSTIRSEWASFWKRAGALGYLLLDKANQNDLINLDTEVFKSVDELRADIKAVLFNAAPGETQVVPREAAVDERVLQGILLRFIEKNRGAVLVEAPPAALPNPPENNDDETMETVILAPRPIREKFGLPSLLGDTYINPQTPPPPEDTQHSLSAAGDDGLLETVLLASPRGGRLLPPVVAGKWSPEPEPPVKDVVDDSDQLSETIVIMPQSGRPRPRFPRD